MHSIRPTARRSTMWALCAWGALGAGVLGGPSMGCKRRTPRAVKVPPIAQNFDAGPIDAGALEEAPGLRRHVLNMGLPELQHRLPAFRLRSQSTLGIQPTGQDAVTRVHDVHLVVDERGNAWLRSGNSEHTWELIAHDTKAYVRQDRGHLRVKRRQEMELTEMFESQVSGLRQMLQMFVGAQLTHPERDTVKNRAVFRYTLVQTEHEDAAAEVSPSMTLLPVAAPSRWREEATHPHLDGSVVVDAETGVVLSAQATGTLQLLAPGGSPASLTLRLNHSITDLGRITPIAEPSTSIAEFRRPVRPRDPLHFFKEAQRPGHPAKKADRDGGSAEDMGLSEDGMGTPTEPQDP
jgi:hypothetical protein